MLTWSRLRPGGSLYIMSKRKFNGPIFIVGMPRSGTKLLREILNNHSLIAISENESHCIPYFYNKFNKIENFKDKKNFKLLYQYFSETFFFQRLTQKINFINEESWYDSITDFTYSGVIEAFYQSYTQKKNKKIWGDKTPSYLLHMPLLKSLFPEAKFIHIIRDVRDYCLSIHKAWNKNIFRAAQRWNDSIVKCRKNSKILDDTAYLEVKYENIIDDPEKNIISICKFLNIPYESNMVSLSRVVENMGDAKNYIGILKKNYGKWENEIKSNKIRKIEKICGSLLKELNYSVSFNGRTKKLSKIEMAVYQIMDIFNVLKTEFKFENIGQFVENIKKTSIHRIVNRG